MSHKQSYATSNEDTFKQYNSVDNVVTKNTLYAILEHRLENGDIDAGTYIDSINDTKHKNEKNMFNKEELLFIAKYLMHPDSIRNIATLISETYLNYRFMLDGIEYNIDDYDTMTCIEYGVIPVTPEFLVSIIEEHDPEQIRINKIIERDCKSVIDNTSMSYNDYIRNAMDVMNYLSNNLNDTDVSLHDIGVKYVIDSLFNIDYYGLSRIRETMKHSINPRYVSYKTPNKGTLVIERSLMRGLVIRDLDAHGIKIMINKNKTSDQYMLHVNTDEMYIGTITWDDITDEENNKLHITLNLIDLCSSIKDGFIKGMNEQQEVNDRNCFDVYVYDSSNVDSILSLGIAVQQTNRRRLFNYQIIDINDKTIDCTKFKELQVCFLGGIYGSVLSSLIIKNAARVVTFINDIELLRQSDRVNTDTHTVFIASGSVASDVWRYFIGGPTPKIIELFNNEDSQDYVPDSIRNGILKITRNDNVLKHVVPLVDDLISCRGKRNVFLPDSWIKIMDDNYSDNIVDMRLM